MNAPGLPKAAPVAEDLAEEDWLELRRLGIGGSDIAAVLGFSRWTSPTALYFDKVGIFEASEETEAMRWGKILEQPVREEFSRRTSIQTIGFDKPVIYRSHELAIAQASPDGLSIDEYGRAQPDVPIASGWYEGKTSWRHGESWTDEDGKAALPLDYEAQTMWELAVSGLPVCHVGALLPGPRFLTFTVERDEKVIADLMQAADRFWRNYVERHVIPPVDGTDSTTRALKHAFGHSVVEDEVELGPGFLQMQRDRRDFVRQRDLFQDSIDQIDNAFRAAMGEHKVGTVDGQKVASYPLIKGTHVEAHDRPDYRRLTISKPKEA